MDSLGDDQQAILQFSQEMVIRLSEKLLEGGAPGLHFYSMNQLHPIQEIYQAVVK